ncbi:SMI1/KNR4 family protein [Salipaludibacillus sp. LMS25]|jgi:cell wall assembly regulator SMI1|uniref:SMI1/KNR4 family protein n=1 Tax=Salipaludibacillus sp. LMS25 TaxID=2924031 RepID=UPI0020CFF2A0|nr:SMI1/KNR4 family protein [Salipaludibacillus sp. LMS25]UTR15708.1 SMI1/KNR4 family protein [Salipaludibacillus sp. LMS25]
MIFQSRNEELKFFFDEIKKYTTNVHSLNPGVNSDQIEEVEKKLDINLPYIYKVFLQVCNGGELFIPGTVLAEIYHPELGEKQKGISYINESYREDRRPPEMSNNLCIIADLNYGNVIAFDLSTNNGQDAIVVQWDNEAQIVSRTWSGFSEWLTDVLEEGSMLVDYNGNEKELDF